MRETPINSRKTQRQHFDRGMAVDEVADRGGREHHHAHGDHDGGDHHAELARHADGGDHGVEREHEIEEYELADDAAEGDGRAGGARRLVALESLVNLAGAFRDEDRPPARRIRSRPEIRGRGR